jgi:ankyrin repeat protein
MDSCVKFESSVKILLADPVDVNHVNKDGFTDLVSAAMNGGSQIEAKLKPYYKEIT